MLQPPPLSEQHRSTIEDFASSEAWAELRQLMQMEFCNDWLAAPDREAREDAYQRQVGLGWIDTYLKKYAGEKAKREADALRAAAEEALRRSTRP